MHDIAEFLGTRDPFSGLEEKALEDLASRTEVEFFPAGSQILPQGEQPQGRVRVVRRGAVELVDRGKPVDLLGEGEMFGHPSVLSGEPTRYGVRAREDTLTYSLAANDVTPLLSRPSSLRYLARSLLARGRRAGGWNGAGPAVPEVSMQPAASLVRRAAVVVSPETSLRDAARRMNVGEVSSVLVDLGDGQYGIVTDRDLRSQVVAGRVSADEPVTAAMTTPVIGVAADQTGADVMLTMLDNNVRHVVVFSPRSEVLGVIVAVDLVAAETRSPFVLRRSIAAARNKRELQQTVTELRSTVIALWRASLAPHQISEVVSAVTDALVRRVIELAMETEGPPPAELCWMALGSHGRREPVPSSDVDSGMAWRDAPEHDPLTSGARRVLASSQTKRYMNEIASSVSDCIRVLGWSLDAHGVTASGFASSSIEDWRHSIETWLRKPTDNKVLIAVSILLDGRIVYGSRALDVRRLLFETGDREVLEQWMLRLALAAKPPTGFMRNIVVEGSGKRRGTFDIKHGGLLPIVDLARYAALKGDISLNSTLPRLRAAAQEGIFKPGTAQVLEEAYELFCALRFEHQVAQLERGDEPDDHLDPEELDPLTRRYLRDAFREVATVQRALSSGLPSRR
jgi:CBS domain-containing protein